MKRRNLTIDSAFALLLVLLLSCGPSGRQPKDDKTGEPEWALLPFVKVDSLNPILMKGTSEFTCPVRQQLVRWDEKDVFNPAAVVREGKVYMVFRAEDVIGKYAGTSRLGLAVSTDGLHFEKMPAPVFYPDNDSMKIYEWEGGVEDPRIVESADGRYIMTYTAYDGQVARLCLASSTDLIHWAKHGLVLNGKYKNAWSKSGAIVASRQGERIVAAQVNGKYWMYFGDTDLFMVSSDDLIHWTPLEENDTLKSVLKPRPGYFDSQLVESGPYALLTEKGILLLYNGMNLPEGGDPSLAKGAYCSGQALFAAQQPDQLVSRLEKNFLRPDQPYEMEGQINQVCFIEGMVPFQNRWFLYFGTADSRIAVAVKDGI